MLYLFKAVGVVVGDIVAILFFPWLTLLREILRHGCCEERELNKKYVTMNEVSSYLLGLDHVSMAANFNYMLLRSVNMSLIVKCLYCNCIILELADDDNY